MPTNIQVTALPHSLADGAAFQLSVFITHKLTDQGSRLADYPAAADWGATLSACTWTLVTDTGAALPLRVTSSPASEGLLGALSQLDPDGPIAPLLSRARSKTRRELGVMSERLRDALATIGSLTDPEDRPQGRREENQEPPDYPSEIADVSSPVQILLDDPEADLRTTKALDALVGQDLTDPNLRLLADAHAVRRFYERPEQPQPQPRLEPDPGAAPFPAPTAPSPTSTPGRPHWARRRCCCAGSGWSSTS